MTALTDALAACIQIHENQGALADPTTMAYNAELAFKQAVLAAISALENVAPAGDVPAQSDAPALAVLQAQNAELTAKVAAGEQAISAFEAIIHPAEPIVAAAPVEIAPTIAPTTGSAT